MAMNVRRIVTSHDGSGKAVVKTDEQLAAVSRGLGADISGCEIWSTDQMPVDNSAAADGAQRAGFGEAQQLCRQRSGHDIPDQRVGPRPCEIHAPNRNHGLRDRTVR
jgi:hypothetical protein